MAMNKAELVAKMAAKSGLTKADADRAVKAFMECVKEELSAGGKVVLVGLFTLSVSIRKARRGKNPRTGAEMKIPEARRPKAKFSKEIIDAVN